VANARATRRIAMYLRHTAKLFLICVASLRGLWLSLFSLDPSAPVKRLKPRFSFQPSRDRFVHWLGVTGHIHSAMKND
jgi:hypothetical protein